MYPGQRRKLRPKDVGSHSSGPSQDAEGWWEATDRSVPKAQLSLNMCWLCTLAVLASSSLGAWSLFVCLSVVFETDFHSISLDGLNSLFRPSWL